MTIKRSAHKKPGTHIRRGSVTRSMTMKACAALGGWLLLGPAQLTSADDQPGVWWGDVTHQVLPTSNGNMVQVNWAVTLICPTGCEDEPPSFVGIRVKAFDCTGDEVYSEERPISLDCGASAAGMYYFDIPYAP